MRTLLSFLLFFICIFSQVFGQNEKLIRASIPFELVENKYILIRAAVNGHDTLTFFFDTGATTTLLDSKAAARLGIKPGFEQEVEGAAGKIKYQVALNQSIGFSNLTIDSVHFVLDDLSRLRYASGLAYDGIIGNTIIETHITELDFENKRINLYPFGEPVNTKGFTEHSFTFENDIPIPIMPATITLKNKSTHTGKVFFDSGAGLSLLMNTPFKEENRIVEQSPQIISSKSNNLSNETVNQQIAIDRLEFASYTFPEMPIHLASDKAGVSAYKGYMGILGADIINRFNFMLNYEARKLYLKPNSLHSLPFDFPRSGLKLKLDENGNVVIADVYEGSDAYKKGVRANDIVLAINNRKKATIQEYRKLFNRSDLSKVTLEVRNKDGDRRHTIQLKRLI